MNLIKQSLYRQAFASDHSLPSDYNGSRIITIAAGRGTCCSYFCGYIMFPQPFTITAARCLAKRLLIAVFRPPILSAHPRK